MNPSSSRNVQLRLIVPDRLCGPCLRARRPDGWSGVCGGVDDKLAGSSFWDGSWRGCERWERRVCGKEKRKRAGVFEQMGKTNKGGRRVLVLRIFV